MDRLESLERVVQAHTANLKVLEMLVRALLMAAPVDRQKLAAAFHLAVEDAAFRLSEAALQAGLSAAQAARLQADMRQAATAWSAVLNG